MMLPSGKIEIKIMFVLSFQIYWQLQAHVDYWGEEDKRAGVITSEQTVS